MPLRTVVTVAALLLVASASAAKPKAKPAPSKPAPAKAEPAKAEPAPAKPEPAKAEPTPAEVLQKVDAVMAPAEFEAKLTFVTHKARGDAVTFSMSFLKKADKFHSRFLAPADDAGSEVLRVGNDYWDYLPNLKRALKISAKQEFHGGDFANSDMLTLDMARDYTPALIDSGSPEQWLLELKAKNDEVTYAQVKIRVRKSDGQPLEMEYYSSSGKLVRRMELSEQKSYGTLVRPSKMVMRNMLEPKRYSEVIYESLTLRKGLDDALFDQGSLGR